MTPISTRSIGLASALVLAITTFGTAPPALAICGISNCSTTCSTDAVLANGIDCSGGSGIVLASGADLTMNGFNVTCTSSCPARAITMSGNNSVITAGGATISGAFGTALVDCALKTGSRVSGTRFEATAANAIGAKDCAKLDGNVLIGPNVAGTSAGILTGGTANSDYIKDNYLDGWRSGIRMSGSKDILVQHNMVNVPDIASQTLEEGIEVDVGTSGAITITKNVLFGDPPQGDLMVIGEAGAITENYCDPSSAACEDCYFCTTATTPFAFP